MAHACARLLLRRRVFGTCLTPARSEPKVRRRRARLERLLGPLQRGGAVHLMDSTTDPDEGAGWISADCAAVGIEGTLPHLSTVCRTARDMIKLRIGGRIDVPVARPQRRDTN
jgi:hypothetical protein